MKLTECIKIKQKMQVENENIKSIIYNILVGIFINNDDYLTEEVERNFVIEENLSNDEFSIIYTFGNMDFHNILKMRAGFLEEKYELFSITDTQTRKNQDGLVFYFKRV